MTSNYPPLYYFDKNGKERVWTVYYTQDSTFKEYGLTLGKITRTADRKFTSKNVGKKNETTPAEQAKKEALSDWITKVSDGFKPSPNDEEGNILFNEVTRNLKSSGNKKSGLTSSITNDTEFTPQDSGIIATELGDGEVKNKLAMTCEKWSTDKKCLKYFDFTKGVYVQPKYDGVRCTAFLSGTSAGDGEVVFLSRQRKQFPFLNHIRNDIKAVLCDQRKKGRDLVLDFEFYAHVLYGEKSGSKFTASNAELEKDKNFDLISSACRPGRSNPHPLEGQLCAFIFDIVDENLTQDERFKVLDELANTKVFKESKSLVKGETILVYSPEEVSIQHDLFAQRDYEGIIIRAYDAKYEPDKRSYFIRKHKYFSDKEYKIIGVEKDAGVGDQYFTWVCENAKGKKFNVTPKGTQEWKKQVYANPDIYFGKMLTVRYQELTSDGIPRFPRGIGIREFM
jgi:hypothetical protein